MPSQMHDQREFTKALEEFIKHYTPRLVINNSRVALEDIDGNILVERDVKQGVVSRRVLSSSFS